jgi:hypothetical protein
VTITIPFKELLDWTACGCAILRRAAPLQRGAHKTGGRLACMSKKAAVAARLACDKCHSEIRGKGA